MRFADSGAGQGRPTLSQFRNAPLFWTGTLLAAVGTGLHFPLYIDARSMHYQVSKMQGSGAFRAYPGLTCLRGMRGKPRGW